MSFEIIYKQPTLREVINQIKRLSNKYNVDIYFCGRGDGSVKLQCETKEYIIIGNNHSPA